MDNLRAFALLLGVFYHAALAYSPLMHHVWPTADVTNSEIVDVFSIFSHLFRMPLFFLIAGFFACMLYRKRGLKRFITNRLSRITLPFIIFLPLILISIVIIFEWAFENVEFKSNILNFLYTMLENPKANSLPYSTTHLWFLYHLTFFYIFTVIALKYIKLNISHYILAAPKKFIFLFPLILVPALIVWPVMIPPPGRFVPELWSFGYFGVFYLLGWMLYQNRTYIKRIEPYWKLMLIISVITYALYYLMLPKVIPLEEELYLKNLRPRLTLMQCVYAILEAYISFYMTFVLLIAGGKYFGGRSSVMRLISDSSYWIYIIHIPVVFFIQFVMLDISFSWYVELMLSSVVIAIIGMATYLLFVRWTPIGWLLNGRKSRKIQASLNSDIIPSD